MDKYNFKAYDVVISDITGDVGAVKEVNYSENNDHVTVSVVWSSGVETLLKSKRHLEDIPISKLVPYPRGFCKPVRVNKDDAKPGHYSDNDPFKIMEDNCTFEEIMGAVKLNIIKYALRTKGQDKEDLEKIIAYANWALKQYEF